MMRLIRSLCEDVIDLVYPQICAACDHGKPVKGSIFCVDCLADLPETGYHTFRDNPLEKQFLGRVKLESASAKYFFTPGGPTQTLLHNIKYRGRRDFAEYIGREFGREMLLSGTAQRVGLVMPVPLHWKKKRQRGFNQSDAFARGLATALDIQPDTTSLQRVKQTETQTRKSRAERVKNMQGAFAIRNADRVRDNHVLIVDDVITTGATLESCALKLLEVRGVSVSVASIACGRI